MKEASRKAMDYNSQNTIYGLGFLGAAFYFIQHAPTFWDGVLGVIKAIFWPGVLVYKVLELLKM
jgi:hypothetical protein